ncbi:hemicentin-2-like isoform X2 [Bolinopsis microptera]|uniref:hemicentin-2-like isoform X2 n=1 Tax=Bolinopsis microptera TaxID=2820187 RepID=UPI003079137E
MLVLVLILLTGLRVEAEDGGSVAFYFKSEPADSWVALGGALTLSCGTSTTVEKTWTWTLYSSTSHDTGTVLEGSGDTLEYGPADMELDNTFVTCSADVFGTQLISRYALIRVSFLETEFQEEPSDLTAQASSDHIRLDCSPPKGSPSPYITWQKDGEDMDLGNTYVDPLGGLNILNVDESFGGSYTCVANSHQGHEPVTSRAGVLTIEGTATTSLLPVTYDLSFAKSRYRISARKGDTVRVLCGFIGNPTPSFAIMVGSEELSGAGVGAHGTWGTLQSLGEISAVKCEGSSQGISQTMNIPIDVTGTLQVAGGIAVNNLEGEETTMVCSESGANGDPTFSWYKNGAKLVGETARYLEILNPSRADSGMYQCFAATVYSKEQSTFAVTISALDPVPVKVTVTSDEYGLLGENAQLSCVGQGNPVPSVTWHRKEANSVNAIAIDNVVYKETFTEVLALLNIENLSMAEDGIEYICKGGNTDLYDSSIIYKADSSITLQVVQAVEPSISLPSTSVIKGGTPLTLICSVEGSPPPTIEWFMNGDKIEEAVEETYVTDGLGGVYVCKATNMLGTVEQEVIVESKPEFSGGEIFLILLIVAFLLLVLIVLLLILVRRNELERRMKEARARDELLIENEKRAGLTPSLPPTPRSEIHPSAAVAELHSTSLLVTERRFNSSFQVRFHLKYSLG